MLHLEKEAIMKKRVFTLLAALVTLLFMWGAVDHPKAYGCEEEAEMETSQLYYRDGEAVLVMAYTPYGAIQADVIFPETDAVYIRAMKAAYPELDRIYVRIRGQLLGTHHNAVEVYHVDRLVVQGDRILHEDRELLPKDAVYGFPLTRIDYGETGMLVRLRLEKQPKVNRDMRRILRKMTDGRYTYDASPDFTMTEQAVLGYILSEQGQALG